MTSVNLLGAERKRGEREVGGHDIMPRDACGILRQSQDADIYIFYNSYGVSMLITSRIHSDIIIS